MSQPAELPSVSQEGLHGMNYDPNHKSGYALQLLCSCIVLNSHICTLLFILHRFQAKCRLGFEGLTAVVMKSSIL
jgi:hypothetical protein